MVNNMFKLFEDLVLYIREQQEEPDPENPDDAENYAESDNPPPEEGDYQQDAGGYDQVGYEDQSQDDQIPGDTPEEKLKNIGKIYRLKKIYARLLSVSKHLDSFNGNGAEELKKKILETIDIFHLITNNYEEFSEKIVEITKLFEKLLEEAVVELERLSRS